MRTMTDSELFADGGGPNAGVAIGCGLFGVGVGLLTVGWGGGIAFGACYIALKND